MPYSRARLLFRHKDIYSDGTIIEIRAWEVPVSVRTPEGKGHHRHEQDRETQVEFNSVWTTIEKFIQEVSVLRGEPI